MGWSFRKSKNIGPVRLNFSKSGVGYSIGSKHMRYTKSATGRKSIRATIPGTGLSYTKSLGTKNSAKSNKKNSASNVTKSKPDYFSSAASQQSSVVSGSTDSSGSCLSALVKFALILCFWPIALPIYILYAIFKRAQHKSDTLEIDTKPEFLEETAATTKVVEPKYSTGAASTYDHYAKQLQESLKIINETNNISTLFSRLDFLEKLHFYITEYGSDEEDLSDLAEEVDEYIDLREEYVNMYLIRQFTAVDDDTTNVTPATSRRRYKKLYERFEPYKSKMSENNIRTYTTLCQQRLEVDIPALPQYSELLTRLNNSELSEAIGEEYYSGFFASSAEAIGFLKKKGYLTVSDDNTKYALTELGKTEAGWLW